jgi:hypothetical protein
MYCTVSFIHFENLGFFQVLGMTFLGHVLLEVLIAAEGYQLSVQ